MGIKIAFFGSSLVSAYWNGAATYYRGIIKALNNLGHSVTFYEPDAYDRQKNRDIPDPDWAAVKVYQPLESEMFKMISETDKADVIIKASGVGVFDDLLEAAVLDVKKPGQMVIFWDVDAPATLDRVESNKYDNFKSLIPKYDFICTYGGGEAVRSAYKKLGAKECYPIYNALDPDTHFPAEPQSNFYSDLSFLGNRLPDREERVERFFISTAEKLPQLKFILGGSGWQDKQLPPNINYLGHVFTMDHNRFNSSPKAVLNISRESMARYGFSPATRVFEAAGAGASIITDYWEGIDQFFEPGKEILVAENSDQIADYLSTFDERKFKEIGEAAYKRVLLEHTYKHRAAQFEQIIEERIDKPVKEA
jgi:spore maturation protein CgeB